MPGSKEGAMKAKQTMYRKYGKDYFREIGAIGGKLGHTGGFAAGTEGRERARKFGAIGGRISRVTKRRADGLR